MTATHREFFIIQYVKDIFRQEGRNIGVMLMLDNMARFQALGQVDRNTTDPEPFLQMNRLPVSSGWFYQEWVNWFHEIAEQEHKEGDNFQQLLRRLDAEGYPFIAKGGGIIAVEPGELPEETLKELMRQLVSRPGKHSKGEFASRLGALVSTLVLHREPGFAEDVEIEFLPSGQPPVTVRVPFLIDPPSGGPRTVFKIVRTKTSIEAFQRQVSDAALTFRLVAEHGFAIRERCIVLTEPATKEKRVRLEYLSSLAHLVIVSDPLAATHIKAIIDTGASS